MKSTTTGKEVVSETWAAATGASLPCRHTGLCCWSFGSAMEEAPPPFSTSLVSTTTRTKRLLPTVAASEAEGSPRPPLAGDGTPTGGGAEGKAQSHWGAVGRSQEKSRDEEAETEEVGEEATGSQADNADLSAAPEVPTEDSPSSASPA